MSHRTLKRVFVALLALGASWLTLALAAGPGASGGLGG